jgi:hypothetical protein
MQRSWNRCASVGNSRRPCQGSETAAKNQGFAEIISLIDTVRYRNWPRRLILIYIRFVGGFPGIVWPLQRSCKPFKNYGLD